MKINNFDQFHLLQKKPWINIPFCTWVWRSRVSTWVSAWLTALISFLSLQFTFTCIKYLGCVFTPMPVCSVPQRKIYHGLGAWCQAWSIKNYELLSQNSSCGRLLMLEKKKTIQQPQFNFMPLAVATVTYLLVQCCLRELGSYMRDLGQLHPPGRTWSIGSPEHYSIMQCKVGTSALSIMIYWLPRQETQIYPWWYLQRKTGSLKSSFNFNKAKNLQIGR